MASTPTIRHGTQIPKLGRKNTILMGRRARMVIAVCNAILRLTLKRGAGDKLWLTENNAILELDDSGSGGIAGNSFIIQGHIGGADDGLPYEFGDYLYCHPWDSDLDGFDTSQSIRVAKPYWHRHSTVVIAGHGAIADLTYAWDTTRKAWIRTATFTTPPGVYATEQAVIVAPYQTGEQITAIEMESTGALDETSGVECTWTDINDSGRDWSQVGINPAP